MQTKQQIQQLLTAAGYQPKKRLGQNFLIDLNLMRMLVDSANIKNTDVVLEVGCGTGSLTEALTEKAGHVITVEIDKKLANIAKKYLAEVKNLEIINTDILRNKKNLSPTVTAAITSAKNKFKDRLLLVANLPYNAASPVMLNLITGPVTADCMYVTIQKEVADRMAAKPANKIYGTLSIFMTATGNTKTLRLLKPSVFWPQPQVNSVMLSFIRSEQKVSRIKSMELFHEVVNLFMGHRRKMLKACTKLTSGQLVQVDNWAEIFQSCSVDPNARPDHLPPDNYIAIANLCHKKLSTI